MTQGKYHPLYDYLRAAVEDEAILSMEQIEAIIGDTLPKSAHTQRGWWSNRGTGAVQAQSWMSAGYHVEGIDLQAKAITFRKPDKLYFTKESDGEVTWTGEMIKALRQELDLSQVELADKLGMRQQTISEWENGVYELRRSSSRLLTFFADSSGISNQIDPTEEVN